MVLAATEQAVVPELVRLINRAYRLGEAGLWKEDDSGRTDEAEIAEAVRGGQMLVAMVKLEQRRRRLRLQQVTQMTRCSRVSNRTRPEAWAATSAPAALPASLAKAALKASSSSK